MKIRLQGVGMKNAIPAEEMKAGDIRMFNFGATELVIKVIEKSEKTLTVISYNNDNGQYYIYNIRKTTPVAIVKRNQDISAHKPQQVEKVSGRNKGMIDVSEYFKDGQQTQKEQKQSPQMENTATKKQRYALYIASNRKIDTRNIIISKEKASELISRSMNGKDITSELKVIAEGKKTEEATQEPEVKQENERQETLADAYNTHKSLIDLIATNRQFNDALRMTDLKPYVVTLQNAYYDVKDNNKYSFVQPVDIHNAVNVLQNSELFSILKSEYVTESEHDNTQQIEEREQTESKDQSQKIKVKEIVFLWSESPVIKDNTTVNTWSEANKIIKDVAFSIDTGGYRKTAFFIVWEDNSTYKGRIDVQASDLYKNAPLSEHIENFALGMAGIKKPYHWSNEEYESYLNGLNVDRESWKNFLDTYMLYDETLKSPTDPSDRSGKRNNSAEDIKPNQNESNEQQEVLFYHENLSKAQNAKINEILNRHKDSNNTIETHELDIQETMQEEAGKLNNTLANESPEDSQADNTHNNDQAETLQVSYKINKEKNGIELYFSEKPSEAIREQLKQYGFKWSRLGFWYAKKTDERLHFTLSLLSDSYNSHLTDEQRKTLSKRLEKDNVMPLRLFKCKNTSNILLECINTNLDDKKPFYFLIRANGEEIGKGYDSSILNDYTLIYTYVHNSEQVSEPITYPDINIDDIETYVIDEKLQEAEHAASWIFRTQKRDHTKEIQELFSSYNRKVIDLLEQTDNMRIKYYLKKSLQSFKKRYFDNYVKILRHRSENPSWAVTGRGNLNKYKYTKALSRYDKLIQESIELKKQIDTAINRVKNEIQKEKEQRIKEAVKNVKNDLTFTIMTKEIEYMGYKERKRVYVYGNYWTARLWGCYRIFKGGQEIYTLKTTQGLEDAKQYIAYLVQQEQEKAKNVITV